MITGIRLKASPTQAQKKTLSQWMGCARYIWNAKTREEKELREKLNSKKTKEYPKINVAYAHLKDKEAQSKKGCQWKVLTEPSACQGRSQQKHSRQKLA